MPDHRATLEQSCWNHERREAVCRCLRCGRSFCRECVSEHEGRLLCAACLRNAAQVSSAGIGRAHRWRSAALLLGGMILAWTVFFVAAESLVTITERSERVSWQGR